MNLPTEVKLCYKTLRLRPFRQEELLANPVSGLSMYAAGEVRYAEATDRAEVADTVLHELLHHIDNIFSAIPPQLSRDDSERIVRLFASGLVTVMRDNPGLMMTLQEMINMGRGGR